MSAYLEWVAAGRPWRDARPIAEIKLQLAAAHPNTVVGVPAFTVRQGGIQTNDAHLKAATPEDHTPYPARPWPIPLPPLPGGYVVCAIDYIHGRGGLDCTTLFPRLLALAKAGLRPWTKYFIWRAQRYDVRNGWEPVPASGHFDHIHESARSDWIDRSIVAFPNPFREDTMAFLDDPDAAALAWRMDALFHGSETIRGGPDAGKTMWVVKQLNDIKTALAAAPGAGGGGPVDEAAIERAVRAGVLSGTAEAYEAASGALAAAAQDLSASAG